MTTHAALTGARWFTSSYSNDQGGQCVESARLGGSRMAVRDSKDPEQGVCVFPAAAWLAFIDEVKDGDTVAS
ncbi:DUF397 domain-containing protein [Streptomyces sp. NBC_01217]|uniref:DUF397 domain-containing protein n=1 Tax=Streptomyces sp. NBC_01217 TaxID=2903779 RepID=UPI002E11C6CB|nr:DUF397 domain-containing protein [Streptomyces sp. NBC_01217]